MYRFVLGVHAADDCPALVRQHRDGGHLGLALYVFLGNVVDVALFVFFQAGLHNPRQNCLFGQDTLAGGIIARAVIRDVQPLGDCRFRIHRPHLLSLHFTTAPVKRPPHFSEIKCFQELGKVLTSIFECR
jgi:hypothetical protein